MRLSLNSYKDTLENVSQACQEPVLQPVANRRYADGYRGKTFGHHDVAATRYKAASPICWPTRTDSFMLPLFE